VVSTDTVVQACSISHASSSGLLTSTPPTTIADGPGVQFSPTVVRTGGSVLVGWNDSTAPGPDCVARSVDPFGCTGCESPFVLGGVHSFNSSVQGCSTASGGGAADDALLVWVSDDGTHGDIFARLWRSADGAVTLLGGNCGAGGAAQATCARVPNPDFAHRLRGATPNSATFLVQSLGQETGVCGPCTRIPALGSAVALFALTDGTGNAAIAAGIPNSVVLRGMTLFDQWLTLQPGGACSQFALDMSNALRIVIE
jgi:hypothetical protein